MPHYYSKVYWHFTGSPKGIDWSKVRRPEHILSQGNPKPDGEAVDILKKILSCRTLLATCTEKIAGYVETPKFCCTCDIPLKDLAEHATFYGKAAIGFHAEAIHAGRFNPVLYISYSNLLRLLPEVAAPVDYAIDSDMAFGRDEPAEVLFAHLFGPAFASLGELKAYIKIAEFSVRDEVTFYREREWRHIGDFSFMPEDVATILVPSEFVTEVQEHLPDNRYPSTIPVISWDFVERV